MTRNYSNKDLRKANLEKNDEFYTQLSDIENELKYYKDQLKNKTIFCNCDDPKESNFVKYFSMNFEHLGLKKLIATHYKEANLFTQEPPYKLEYTGDKNNNRIPDPEEFITEMIGTGDFKNKESIELLEKSDIVVTNPPFSLFREYVAQLIKYKKKFLIMGNQNAITYREIFKLIKKNQMWIGESLNGKNILFQIPNYYKSYYKIINGKKYAFPKGVIWFTNLDVPKRSKELVLYKKYYGFEKEYPMYENYDAINVDRTNQIPKDYDGKIGVPITFLHKYNPNQFEIVGLGISNSGKEIGVRPYTKEHKKYRTEIQKRGAVDGDLYLVENGIVKVPYARVIIKNKKVEK